MSSKLMFNSVHIWQEYQIRIFNYIRIFTLLVCSLFKGKNASKHSLVKWLNICPQSCTEQYTFPWLTFIYLNYALNLIGLFNEKQKYILFPQHMLELRTCILYKVSQKNFFDADGWRFKRRGLKFSGHKT